MAVASSQATAEAAVRTLLSGVGEDVTREGLTDTPKRVAKALLDVTKGYHQTAVGVLGGAYFHEPIVRDGNDGLVLVRDIDFASTSEDTLLPFYGRCHIGYVSESGVVLGLSKLARLTRCFSKRLQTQERLGREVAVALQRQLQCRGVAVVIEATHLTMANSAATQTTTTACTAGCFSDSSSSVFEEMMFVLGIYGLAPGSLLRLQTGGSLQRSTSSVSGASSGALAASGCDAQGHPLPPATPDLSEHCGELDGTSLLSLHVCSSSKGGPLSSDRGSEKDLSDLVSGVSDRELSEHDSDGECNASSGSRACTQIVTGTGLGYPTSYPHSTMPAHTRSLSAPLTPTAAGDCGTAAVGFGGIGGVCGVGSGRSSSAVVDNMERAVLSLINVMGECPHRPGLAGSARRYVMTLLSATSGYTRQLPQPLYPPASTDCSTAVHTDAPTVLHAAPQGCACCQAGALGSGWAVAQQAVSPTTSSGSSSKCSPVFVSAANAGRELRHVRVGFTTQCEHHMLPFHGHADIVYTPYAASAVMAEQEGSEACLRREREAIEQIVWTYTQRLQVQERITHQVADATVHVLGCASVLVVVDAAHMCMVARGVENHGGRTVTMATRGKAAADAALRARALALCRKQ